jgi:hypothetical protein
VAYLPNHIADVFISYSHKDNFLWVERFKQDLESVLIRKLRARTKPHVFFDAHNLRAGRVLDDEIKECLRKTGYFVALVSPPYKNSVYCMQKELPEFVKHNPSESGRLIQAWLDLSAELPCSKVLAVKFADAKGPFPTGSEAYQDALRLVYEPIVTELDKLYAQSKMVFLAWPGDPELEAERERLEAQIEGSGLRVYPEEIPPFGNVDLKLRDALEKCTASVHLLGEQPNEFDLTQWDAAVRSGKPCVVASRNPAEARRGPGGSPPAIYLKQGNPVIAITKAIEQIAGIGRREERNASQALGRTPIFLLFKPDSDAMLGLKIRKRIVSRGPFEVIVPPRDSGTRYEELARAKLALLCRARAGREWLEGEWDALSGAMVTSGLFDLRRVLLLPAEDDARGLEVHDGDTIVHSEEALDSFLSDVKGAAA